MKVLVTGSAGYIGRPLVQQLAEAGHDVVGIDIKIAPHSIQADVRDVDPETFAGVDSVIHLAGVSFAPEWTDTDDLIWDANVEGTRRVVEAAEDADVRRFVFASSASIFEAQGEDDVARLNTSPRPVSAYGRSKACAERIVRSSTIPERVALRKGTLCGLGPNPRLDLVLNAMTLAAMRKGQVFVDGEGKNNRPMLRLSRAVRAYAQYATGEVPEGTHLYNICDDNVTVVGLAQAVCAATGAELIHREYKGRPRSYVMHNSRTDSLPEVDSLSVDLATMVEEVIEEFEFALDSLPDVSADPRVDRLEQINREMRAEKAEKS